VIADRQASSAVCQKFSSSITRTGSYSKTNPSLSRDESRADEPDTHAITLYGHSRRLEAPEERQLDPVVLKIGPVRIGGTDPDCLQSHPKFCSEIVPHLPLIRGFAGIDTLRRSHGPATERCTDGTRHLTGVGGIDRPIAGGDPGLAVVRKKIRGVHHHRGRANRFELAALTAHGCQTGIDVGLAKGGSAKAPVRGGRAARRVADPPAQFVKEVRDSRSGDAF
jgi:hypothetical protein